MNENQHSITVLFNPAPDTQAKTGGPQPTPFCVTACFSNLPAGTDFVKLTKRFYENLMRSLDSAIAECKAGKRDGVVPVQIVTIATALVTAEFGGEAFNLCSPSVIALNFGYSAEKPGSKQAS